MNAVLFIHIPKTAGTSFRLACQAHLDGRIALDYGGDSSSTSDFLCRLDGPERDLEWVGQQLEERALHLLGGHVYYSAYASLFPPERVITFVREPLQRLISEYFHFLRGGFTGEFLDFARRPQNQNRQSRMLAGLELRRIGVLALSERYDDSLSLVRREFGWSLRARQDNRNPDRNMLKKHYEVDEPTRERIRALNRADYALYDYAVSTFGSRPDERPPGPDLSKSITAYGGAVDAYEKGIVRGWAMTDGGHSNCFVQIMVDGKLVGRAEACRPRRDLLAKGLHATGEAGFRLRIGALAPNSEIRCFIDGVDWELARSPLMVPASEES